LSTKRGVKDQSALDWYYRSQLKQKVRLAPEQLQLLEDYRQQFNLKLPVLAKRTGIDQSVLMRIFAGKVHPTVELFAKLLKGLGVKMEFKKRFEEFGEDLGVVVNTPTEEAATEEAATEEAA
jgi:transcriptional regulator with XRE-family HTH domain